MKEPVPARMRRFLRRAAVALQDDPPRIELRPPDFTPAEVFDENRTIISALWKELEYYFMIRNCIAHDSSLVQKARGPERIQGYAAVKGILVKREGQLEIRLNEDFNKNVCDTMEEFFQNLRGAYYAAPLPD